MNTSSEIDLVSDDWLATIYGCINDAVQQIHDRD